MYVRIQVTFKSIKECFGMVRYTLDKKKQGIEVSKHLYGLFFEDINQSADGGLNAEMVL